MVSMGLYRSWERITFALWGSSVRIRSGPPKLEIAAVKTAAISHLTTEIPQTDFCFDHLAGTPSRECPSFLFSAAQNLRGFLRNPGYDGDPASAYDHFMRRAMFLQRIEEDLSSRALNILLSFKLLNPAEPHFPPWAADHLAQGRRNSYGVLCVSRDQEVISHSAFWAGENGYRFILNPFDSKQSFFELQEKGLRLFPGTVIVKHHTLSPLQVIAQFFVPYILDAFRRTLSNTLHAETVVGIQKNNLTGCQYQLTPKENPSERSAFKSPNFPKSPMSPAYRSCIHSLTFSNAHDRCSSSDRRNTTISSIDISLSLQGIPPRR